MNLPLLATEGFGLNLNLFETNILNWAVVIFGLYKFLPSFLGKMLKKRRDGILQELRDAEDRLSKATEALELANNEANASKEKARLEIESQTSAAREQLSKQADDLSQLIVNRLILEK